MTNATPRRNACPRCRAPIEGDFKFCPTCAFRIRPGEEAAPEVTHTVSRWPHVLLTLVLGALILAILILGIDLFGERQGPPVDPDGPGPSRREGPLTVAGDLMDLWVNLPPAYAEERLYLPPGGVGSREWLLVQVGWSRILKYEVTRGMYAEFLRSCEADPARVPTFMRELWRPPVATDPDLSPEENAAKHADALRYSEGYIDRWWIAVQRHLDENLGVELERPADLHAPLPASYGVLLMIPPSWVSATRWESLVWAKPDGTDNLPVTQVSWWDAVAFADWVSAEVGAPIRLPTEVEWIRGGKGGDPEAPYPWGDEAYRYACNCLSLWGDGITPRLHRVDYPYTDADGRTDEGLWAMSGNAREWTHNNQLKRVGAYLQMENVEDLEKGKGEAPTLGGSFQEGIDDCTVGSESAQYLDKRDRAAHIGFRLWMEGGWMDG